MKPQFLVRTFSPNLGMVVLPRFDSVDSLDLDAWNLEIVKVFERQWPWPPLTLWGMLDPTVWHNLQLDIDVNPEVVVMRAADEN